MNTADATKSQEENSSEPNAEKAEASSKDPVPGEKRYNNTTVQQICTSKAHLGDRFPKLGKVADIVRKKKTTSCHLKDLFFLSLDSRIASFRKSQMVSWSQILYSMKIVCCNNSLQKGQVTIARNAISL